MPCLKELTSIDRSFLGGRKGTKAERNPSQNGTPPFWGATPRCFSTDQVSCGCPSTGAWVSFGFLPHWTHPKIVIVMVPFPVFEFPSCTATLWAAPQRMVESSWQNASAGDSKCDTIFCDGSQESPEAPCSLCHQPSFGGLGPPCNGPRGGEGHLHDATLVNTIKVMVPNQVVVGGIVTVGPQRCVFWGAGFPGNESRCFEVRTLPTQNKNRKPKPREFCPCPPECSPQILEI